MRNLKYVIIILVIGIIYGCIPSLHSIVNDKNRITDERVLGLWSVDDGDNTWFFEQASEITFVDTGEGRNNKIEYDIGAESLMPSGMRILDKEELPQYILTFIEWDDTDTITTNLIVNLTTIGDYNYMDFKPVKTEPQARLGSFSFNFISAHTFARYAFKEDQLSIEFIDGQYIQELIEKKRIRLKHEVIGDDEFILTASTEELRQFIFKYQDDDNLFDEPGTLISS